MPLELGSGSARKGINQQALSDYLALMILIWSGCLVVTPLAVGWLVRRIVQPLEQLNAATDQVTAETLASARLPLESGPVEVLKLGRTYNALLERLSMSWSQQRQFVSAVSHELRTPLTIVQGYLNRTVKRGDNLTEAQVRGLRTAEEESIRMRRLMDDLLDLSRGDSGRLSIQNEPVHVADQLEQVADMARSTLERPLELKLPSNPAERDSIAQADPGRLRQVLLDLIENADKYSPADRPILLQMHLDEQHHCIDVIDQGIGIPEAELEEVFERFHRASNAPERTGSGLGLSVVKLLVREWAHDSCAQPSRRGQLFYRACRDDQLPDSRSLLIPVNLWAAITPHLHSDVSMRIPHGVSTLLLLPLLFSPSGASAASGRSAIVLSLFAMVMVVVNS